MFSKGEREHASVTGQCVNRPHIHSGDSKCVCGGGLPTDGGLVAADQVDVEEQEDGGGKAKAEYQKEHEDDVDLGPVVLKLLSSGGITSRCLGYAGL